MAKTCVGLDLGSSAVKLAQVKKARGGTLELVAFGVEPVPSDAVVDGSIMNQSAAVDSVRALVDRLKIKDKNVALAIAGTSVIIKRIFVPYMTAAELEEQIPWEAEQHIPFDKNDVEIDYQLLGGKNAQGQMEVLLVAAKKEVVRDYTAVAREAQLNPVVVDITAFALQNAFESAYPTPDAGEAVVLINVGASTSNINIITGGTPSFTRDVPTGGNLYTNEIKRAMNVSQEEAETVKTGLGDAQPPKELARALSGAAEQMAGEFSKSLDFFLSGHPDTAVSRIYLAGGGARLTALHRALETRAHVPVEVMDPFRQMGLNASPAKLDPAFLHNSGPQAAVAVGLALRAVGDKA